MEDCVQPAKEDCDVVRSSLILVQGLAATPCLLQSQQRTMLSSLSLTCKVAQTRLQVASLSVGVLLLCFVEEAAAPLPAMRRES